jgi:hypothetical protein
MQIFIDSANFKEIEQWRRQGVIDGVTTKQRCSLSGSNAAVTARCE